jgi:hypothetical protein
MPDPEDLYSVVDREAKNESERRESRVLYDALRSRRSDLGGMSHIPAKDHKLTEQILGEARKRSAQISASRQSSISQTLQPPARPIPLWLWVAWLIAITGVVIAFSIYG